MKRWIPLPCLLSACLVLAACEETASPRDLGTTEGKYETYVRDDLLGVLDVRFLKGRCLGKLSINAQTEDARSGILSFAQSLAATIPLDGSKPATDEELKQLIPGSGEIDDWEEDTSDGQAGPWLVTTNAYDWINGGAGPFEENGFEAVATETYIKSVAGTAQDAGAEGDGGNASWKLDLALVNQGSVAGAEAAFRADGWDQGDAP